MFFIRLIGLIFLVAFSFSMGKTPSSGLNAFGMVIALSFFIAAPALYLLPSYEAWRGKHKNVTAIALVNIFLGWSLIGWVVALVWALKKPEEIIVSQVSKAPSPVESQAIATVAAEMRTCPFCAEEIRAAAIKCKHCGSAVDPVRAE